MVQSWSANRAERLQMRFWVPPTLGIFNQLPDNRVLSLRDQWLKGRTPLLLAVAFMVAGGGFEPPTFGLCDLTHLSMRVGLYLHPRGVLAIQSLRLPPVSGAWFGIALSL